jgi:23S rRNA (uridine2552-2'-O)-methyltransferase
LIQINKKFNIFENAKYVLDLGAAPGGWLQVASESITDPDALVLGVDLNPIKPINVDNVVTIVGDLRDLMVQDEIHGFFDGKVDIILSDMAPDVIGQWDVDQYRQIDLARIALRLCDRILNADGWFVVKIFQGIEHIGFIKDVNNMFEYVKNFKPAASRKQSAERYIVANKLKKIRKLPETTHSNTKFENDTDETIPGDQLFFDEYED